MYFWWFTFLAKSTLILESKHTSQGFIWRFYFGAGNMVDKDSKKRHSTLLCTVGAFATSQL
jgi:hypothetical protein